MGDMPEIKAIICGCVHRETIVNLAGQVFPDQIGGSLIYAASGFRFWSENPGLVARISQDTPDELINQLKHWGMNTDGLQKNDFIHEMRAFYSVLSQDEYDTENPTKYFINLINPFPKHLLGYSGIPFSGENRKKTSPITLLPEHIPPAYVNCESALLCSVDYLSLSMLPPFLRMNGIKNLVLKPSTASMNSSFWNEIPVLVRGSNGMICTKKEALDLFLGKNENLLEIIETLASFGLDFVIITKGEDGQHLYDRSTRSHWIIPAYPTRVLDCIHASDSFAGGFLAGFLKYYDPLMAVFYGNITASLKLEGSGAFYLLNSMPELANARLNVLKEKAKKL